MLNARCDGSDASFCDDAMIVVVDCDRTLDDLPRGEVRANRKGRAHGFRVVMCEYSMVLRGLALVSVQHNSFGEENKKTDFLFKK